MLILILFWLSLTLKKEELVFSGLTMLPYIKETKVGNRDQEASLSAGKNIGVVFLACFALKFFFTAISIGVDISEVSGCHLLWQWPTGLGRCSKNWRFPGSNPTMSLAGLRDPTLLQVSWWLSGDPKLAVGQPNSS